MNARKVLDKVIWGYIELKNIKTRGILEVKGINRNDPAFIFIFSLISINFHFHNIPGPRNRAIIYTPTLCHPFTPGFQRLTWVLRGVDFEYHIFEDIWEIIC